MDTSKSICEFIDLTQTDEYVAFVYLSENNWDLETSINAFYTEKFMQNYNSTSHCNYLNRENSLQENSDVSSIVNDSDKDESKDKLKQLCEISCADQVVAEYYMKKNDWDFQKSLQDIIEDKFQDVEHIIPQITPIVTESEIKSDETNESQISENKVNSSIKENKININTHNFPKLIEKFFHKRKNKCVLSRQNTNKSYEYNAIDNAGDRMINGGVLSEDASSNKSGNEIRDSNTHSDFSTGSSSHLESMKVRRENILSELVDTESKYVIDLNEVLVNYRDKLAVSNLTETRQRANTIFGNLDEIHDFHNSTLYPELERCGASPASVAKVFITNCQTIKSLYSAYCQNMSASRQAVANLGGETTPTSILLHCQQEAGHQLPLSSYLLKPMQRLTKYQLLLKYLAEASDIVSGKVELDEALEELLTVVKVVNDSLHNITIKGLPSAAQPLGALVTHDIFTVTSENNKSALTGAQILLLRGNRGQRRHVFLYENHVVFAKVVSEKSQVYGFKFCLATASLGMSSVVKGDDKKIDLWLLGRSSDSYTLEGKTKKAKDEFASELRKVINRQKERNKSTSRGGSLSQKYALQNPNHVNEMQIHPNSGPQQAAYYDTASTTCSGESGDSQAGDRLSRNVARSRSLESGRVHAPLRSRSVDCAADRNSPIDDDDLGVDEDEDAESGGSTGAGGNPRTRMHRSGGRYIALADYMALTSREIDLTEDEVVELIKVGCAGWWYVRLTTYPYPEGWTPSTYLEKLHERN